MNVAARISVKIHDGNIVIPEEYREGYEENAELILFRNAIDKTEEPKKKRELRAFGGLSHYANPELWPLEEGAMERALVKNYEAEKHQYEID